MRLCPLCMMAVLPRNLKDGIHQLKSKTVRCGGRPTYLLEVSRRPGEVLVRVPLPGDVRIFV